ncbi:MAG TPA: chromosomal replication initiator protein DnaA [Candidatus Moranbacteria bacterium]|nr:chromosomal replication initiator protein DnaA [Candidatus Moranbacteria bacterium]
MTNEELWQSALGEIELSISKANFITWFKNTSILSNKDGQIVINVPNGFAKEWLENKYNLHILRALRNFQEDIKSVSCVIATNKESVSREPSVDAIIAPPKTRLDFQKTTASGHESNLNPRYIFDNFVVGGSNELAKAACFAVSQNLGRIYNPLFIYGGVGLGKTHLIQSIGNEILKNNPDFKVKYITSERFTSELIDSIKNQKIHEFKEYYQKIDLLIIDDIQFISGKEKTQEEFFHIFNHLYQLNKQIVLSSDRAPKAIQILEERLRSRFEGGMIADVSKPDFETRMAILRKKVADETIPISNEAIEFIATNVKNNIRELEGALNRVLVSAQLTKQTVTPEYVSQILSELISSGKKKGITHKHIIKVVSEFYDIDPSDLVAKNRKQEVVKPRQIAMYLMRTELQYSYPGIGSKMGGRDHTTAIHAFEKISEITKKDEKILEEINFLKDQLYTII